MKATLTPEELSSAIKLALDNYSEARADAVKKAVEQVADEVDAEIRKNITFRRRTGKYEKAFTKADVFENATGKRIVWYVKGSQARLTQLLERGHKTVNGRRTRAFPHIIYGAKLAQKRLPELIEKNLKEG